MMVKDSIPPSLSAGIPSELFRPTSQQLFVYTHCLCTTQICGARATLHSSRLGRFFAFCGVPAAMLTEFTWWLSVCWAEWRCVFQGLITLDSLEVSRVKRAIEVDFYVSLSYDFWKQGLGLRQNIDSHTYSTNFLSWWNNFLVMLLKCD